MFSLLSNFDKYIKNPAKHCKVYFIYNLNSYLISNPRKPEFLLLIFDLEKGGWSWPGLLITYIFERWHKLEFSGLCHFQLYYYFYKVVKKYLRLIYY